MKMLRKALGLFVGGSLLIAGAGLFVEHDSRLASAPVVEKDSRLASAPVVEKDSRFANAPIVEKDSRLG